MELNSAPPRGPQAAPVKNLQLREIMASMDWLKEIIGLPLTATRMFDI